MTYQETIGAINDAAILAAQFVADAYGSEVPAEVAWRIINEEVYRENGRERPAALPAHLTRQFRHDYQRHMCSMLAGVR